MTPLTDPRRKAEDLRTRQAIYQGAWRKELQNRSLVAAHATQIIRASGSPWCGLTGVDTFKSWLMRRTHDWVHVASRHDKGGVADGNFVPLFVGTIFTYVQAMQCSRCKLYGQVMSCGVPQRVGYTHDIRYYTDWRNSRIASKHIGMLTSA